MEAFSSLLFSYSLALLQGWPGSGQHGLWASGPTDLAHPELLSTTNRLPVEGPQTQQRTAKAHRLWRAAALHLLAAVGVFLQEGEERRGGGLCLPWTPGLSDRQPPSPRDGLQGESCRLQHKSHMSERLALVSALAEEGPPGGDISPPETFLHRGPNLDIEKKKQVYCGS